MTTADIDLREIPGQRDVVDARLAELQELSTSMPTAELVVGTPEYHPDRIYNSLVIIQNGIRRVLERKRTIFSSAERGHSPQATHCSNGILAHYLLCVPI